MNRTKERILAITGLIVLGLAGIALTVNEGGENASQLKPRILPVRTVVAEEESGYTIARTYTGRIVARRSSDLSFEIAGRLISVDVEEGDVVSKNANLAMLDLRELKASRRETSSRYARAMALLREMKAGPRKETIDSAKAEVMALRAKFQQAETEHRRRADLFKDGVGTERQFDNTRYARDAAAARLKGAEHRLRELQAGTRKEKVEAQQALVEELASSLARIDVKLSQGVIQAPFAGTISRRLADEGVIVNPGRPVLRLLETSTMEVRVGIPADRTSAFKIGSNHKIRVRRNRIDGVVTSLLPDLDAATRTATVVLTIRGKALENVRPGQIAHLVARERISSSAFRLPQTALIRGVRGLWSLYIVVTGTEGGYRVGRRDVEILHVENDYVVVRGTLRQGDHVIPNGVHRVTMGQSVLPLEQSSRR